MLEVKTAGSSHGNHGGDLQGFSLGVEIIVSLFALTDVEAHSFAVILTDFKIAVGQCRGVFGVFLVDQQCHPLPSVLEDVVFVL